MILYRRSKFFLVSLNNNMPLQQWNFRVALVMGLTATICTVGLKLLDVHWFQGQAIISFTIHATLYTSLTGMLSLIIVFRTSQVYVRFWEGAGSAHQLMGDLFVGTSNLVAYTRVSQCGDEEIGVFVQTLIRLVSLLSSVMLAELEGRNPDETRLAESFELIDINGLERTKLIHLKRSLDRPEIVFQWVKGLIVDNIKSGVLSIPPPILTRVFQELDHGMSLFHDALKLANVPFPYPYVITIDLFLCLHTVLTPAFLLALTTPIPACIYVFVLVFVLWSMHLIASELENPYEGGANDLNMKEMQFTLNRRLLEICNRDSQDPPALRSTFAEALQRAYRPWARNDKDSVICSLRNVPSKVGQTNSVQEAFQSLVRRLSSREFRSDRRSVTSESDTSCDNDLREHSVVGERRPSSSDIGEPPSKLQAPPCTGGDFVSGLARDICMEPDGEQDRVWSSSASCPPGAPAEELPLRPLGGGVDFCTDVDTVVVSDESSGIFGVI